MKVFWIVIFLSVRHLAIAQDTILNRYGLWVIEDPAAYKKSITGKKEHALVDLKTALPGIAMEYRYGDSNNFTGQKLYPPINSHYLRKTAVQALAAAEADLKKMGLGLKIFDAYRPYAVTVKMWELVKDERYAADPKKGSAHNRGVAVDLTIIDAVTKKAMDMGTGFDNFSDTAHHQFKALPLNVLQNRQLLKTIMEKHGFNALETEWWHYALPNVHEYPILNLRFEELQKLTQPHY
jgi:D-alanyl-D-alanine dipeptidase